MSRRRRLAGHDAVDQLDELLDLLLLLLAALLLVFLRGACCATANDAETTSATATAIARRLTIISSP